MEDKENYKVELSSDEIHSLMECLAELRKHYVENGGNRSPLDNPVFVAASELQHKIAHVINPDLNLPVDEYLDYGK